MVKLPKPKVRKPISMSVEAALRELDMQMAINPAETIAKVHVLKKLLLAAGPGSAADVIKVESWVNRQMSKFNIEVDLFPREFDKLLNVAPEQAITEAKKWKSNFEMMGDKFVPHIAKIDAWLKSVEEMMK